MSIIPTSEPISERIASAIADRLFPLTAGYNSRLLVSEIIRPLRLGGFTPKDNQIVITCGEPARQFDQDRPGNPPAIAYLQQFNIRCHLMTNELDTTPIDTYVNYFVAAVIQVMTDDSALDMPWYNFGGLSIDARFDGLENIDSDGSFDGVNIPLHVTYRVSENNPYVVRG